MEKPDSPLRKWRKDSGLNLDEACDKFAEMGFERPSPAKLSRIETGQPVPREMIEQFAAVTGLPAKEIDPDLAKLFVEQKVDAA